MIVLLPPKISNIKLCQLKEPTNHREEKEPTNMASEREWPPKTAAEYCQTAELKAGKDSPFLTKDWTKDNFAGIT
jgi:hypothetical protein